MDGNELKKLGRRELLELLMELETENAALSDELKRTKQQFENQEIAIRECGSIAEASLKLSGVFAAADTAVKQYQENIKRYSEQQKQEYDRIIADATEKAQEIIHAAELEKKTKIKEADEYWETLQSKLNDFYQAHEGLRELLSLHIGPSDGGKA